MMIIRETAGDTLAGAVDGSNKTFETTYDYEPALVNVFFNGILLVQSLETGYTLTPPRTVVMNEAPLVGDTLEIEYAHGAALSTGGALGGVPVAPSTAELKPAILGTVKKECED